MTSPHDPDRPDKRTDEDDQDAQHQDAETDPSRHEEPGDQPGDEATPDDDADLGTETEPAEGETAAQDPDAEPGTGAAEPEAGGSDESGAGDTTPTAAGEGEPEGEPAEQAAHPEGGTSEDPASEGAEPAADQGDADDARDAGARGSGDAEGEDAREGSEPRQRHRWAWVAVFLVVLVLGVLGGWAVSQIAERVGRLEQRLAAVPDERAEAIEPFARSAELQSARQSLQQRIDSLASEQSAAVEPLRQRVAELEEAIATVRELAGRRQLDWRLAEVDYLLEVAARRLAIARDRRSAIAALEAADRSLASIGDVRLVDLRRTIVDDIAALEQAKPADVEGIALRVQALLERLPNLPTADAAVAETDGDGTVASVAGTWWEGLKQSLSRYVVVRKRPDASPVRPEVEAALPAEEKLRLALSEARSAALRQEPEPYTAAIERARKQLRTGYRQDAPITERFAAGLEDLAQRPVQTEYPDLTETLEEARRVAARLQAEAERIQRTREGQAVEQGSGESGSAKSSDDGGE